MKQQRVGIAMSGGVDSTACALLLKNKYPVSGFFMNLGQPDFIEQKERVEKLAETIGIDIHIIDLKKQFQETVLNYFSKSYFSGKTPNPCMICNREIKFGLFMDAIMATGVDLVATGHYARLEQTNNDIALLTGIDPKKDQSYFLSRLTRQQLSRILFPLGSMLKEDIYRFVENRGFTDFRGNESQDICFLKHSTVAAFLEERFPQAGEPGAIVTTAGTEIGEHKGLYRYTIGQRRGLGLPDATPWYVNSIDAENNTLIVGKNDTLYSFTLTAVSANWLAPETPRASERFMVRIRYSHPGSEAIVQSIDNHKFTLHFSEPQRAIAPGQFAVLYEQDRLIGSGVIVSS